MIKKLDVCLCMIICLLCISACGSEKDEAKAAPVFSADIDYSSDRKARKEFLEEIQKLLEEKINYGDKDIVAMYGDPSILFAQGSDELDRDKWGNTMPPTKTGERIVP